ncbi:MAG: NUDIX domain-containing protein [Minisyncoccales bacterium]
MTELIDICDENNNIIGQAMKSEALARGLWHRVARVLIYDRKGRIFLQLRSMAKELHPGCWDVGVAGHIGAGEDYVDAAIREAQEELGLRISKEMLNLLMIEKFEQTWDDLNEKVFAGTYLAKFDGNICDLKIQAKEVQELKFVFVDDLERDVKSNPKKYSPHPEPYWLTLINGVRNRFGIGS